ncbi:hypothetical protein GCM10010912_64280 [Paenibacillus albidus]|uniref:Uncharacterized protein n=1 Tax=Paenibacillus albidus TaxID=2041023 RepID=A0A917D629_9BACL|nr:hypothetical protein [Paenibacillus albidus]GGG10990.1 hypothetical protein GCM10010912_64280 [Paenibacillus albidus]
MKNYLKQAISGVAAMTMLLAPMQAVFADEAVTNTNHSAAQVSGNIGTQGIIYGNVGDPSMSLYLSGPLTISVNAPSGGNFVVYGIHEYTGYHYLGEIIGSGSINASLYGNYKISVTSSFPGTYTVKY